VGVEEGNCLEGSLLGSKDGKLEGVWLWEVAGWFEGTLEIVSLGPSVGVLEGSNDGEGVMDGAIDVVGEGDSNWPPEGNADDSLDGAKDAVDKDDFVGSFEGVVDGSIDGTIE
jgi:hypothetical protein